MRKCSVRVNDTSICTQKKIPDDPCVTSEQSALLLNTVLVAEGIHASQWDGGGAVEGTNLFSTFSYSGDFIAHLSVLEESANPEHHTVWDDITSVIWMGGRITHSVTTYNKFHTNIRFTRTDGGQWPELLEDDTIGVSIQSYACVRGQDW